MLKKIVNFVFLISFGLFYPTISMSTSHHSGHGGGSGAGGGGVGARGCPKISVTDMEPVALAELAPGSHFSVVVLGAKTADDIEMTVKKIPVAFKIENKGNFIEVNAKLPDELRGVAARVTVKVRSQAIGCDQESGWLYKISN